MLRKVVEPVLDSPAPLPGRHDEQPPRVAVQWLPSEWTARSLHMVPSPSPEPSAQERASEWVPSEGSVPVVTLSHCEDVEPPRWPVTAAHASLVSASGYVRTHRRGAIEAASAAALLAALALVATHSGTSSPNQLPVVARAHSAAVPAGAPARRPRASRAPRFGAARSAPRVIRQRAQSSSFTAVAIHKPSHVISGSYVVPTSHPVTPSHARSAPAPTAGIHTAAPLHVHKSPPPRNTGSTGGSGTSQQTGGNGGSNQGPVDQTMNSTVTTAQSVVKKLPLS